MLVISYYARELRKHRHLMSQLTPSAQLEFSKVGTEITGLGDHPERGISEAGWRGRDAILMTGINAIIYILSTLPP